MIFAAKPKPPDAASWINYPLDKSEAGSGKHAKPAEPTPPPATSPGKVVRVEPLAAVPPPAESKPPLAPAAASTPEEITEWDGATEPGLDSVSAETPVSPEAEMPVSHETFEPVAEDPPFTPRHGASEVSTESAEDVFAAHMPKKKKKKKTPPAPPPPPVEEMAADDVPAEAEADRESIHFAPEPIVPEDEAPAEEYAEADTDAEAAAEVEGEGYGFAQESDEPGHKDGDEESGGGAVKWFAVGIFLGGLSAAGVGALFVFHVV
jgi:hypothetical protein